MALCGEDTIPTGVSSSNGFDNQHHPVGVGTGASNLSASRADGPSDPRRRQRASGEEDLVTGERQQDPLVDERLRLPSLRRQGALSDLWQNHRAFRANQHSMKDMFQGFLKEAHSPANAGRSKAEVGDFFAYSARGVKHVTNDSPCEDRIAIQPSVVPTIDDETKAELGIDEIDTSPFSMFAVFDGHGGPACAEFLTKNVSTVLAHSPVLYDKDLAPFERRTCATADTFSELEKVHNAWAHESNDMSGSTAILSTFQDGILVMAGVGDSAGLYVNHLGNTDTLCPKHSTGNAREVARIRRMGGTIINGRVSRGEVAGSLKPTRTIGDLDCKRDLKDIVSPHPELKLTAIYAPPDDGHVRDEPFLVLASDGLWDVLTNEQVASITRKGLRNLRKYEAKEARKREQAAAESIGGNNGNQYLFKRFPKNLSSQRLGGGSGDSVSRDSGAGPPLAPREGSFSNARRGSGFGNIRRSSSAADFSHNTGGLRSGPVDEYLDLSLPSMKLLDVSTRGGKSAAPIKIASLPDRYPVMTAQAERANGGNASSDASNGVDVEGGGGGVGKEGLPPQVVAFKSTPETTSVRTTGLSKHNVAMQLMRAAKGVGSMDDISVVVVTFKASQDKGLPGSRGARRRGGEGMGAASASGGGGGGNEG